MNSLTFQGLVSHGQLQHNTSLSAFEGRQVYSTVSAPSKADAVTTQEAGEAEPPEDLDVEKEIYAQMPRPTKRLQGVQVVKKGPRKPRIILSEDSKRMAQVNAE